MRTGSPELELGTQPRRRQRSKNIPEDRPLHVQKSGHEFPIVFPALHGLVNEISKYLRSCQRVHNYWSGRCIFHRELEGLARESVVFLPLSAAPPCRGQTASTFDVYLRCQCLLPSCHAFPFHHDACNRCPLCGSSSGQRMGSAYAAASRRRRGDGCLGTAASGPPDCPSG